MATVGGGAAASVQINVPSVHQQGTRDQVSAIVASSAPGAGGGAAAGAGAGGSGASDGTRTPPLRRRGSSFALRGGGGVETHVDPKRALELMLVEMRDRATHAESVLKELSLEITRTETEISDWKTMMQRQDALDLEAQKDPLTAFLNGIAVVQRGTVGSSVGADMTNAAQRFGDLEIKIRDLKATEEMLNGEIERDRWDKMRALKLIDIFMLGRSAPTAAETLTFAKFGNAKSEALMRVIRALPVQNVSLLERQGTFKAIHGLLNAAVQQYKRYRFVDLERVASQGVRHTGASLGLAVIHDDMEEDDYLRL